MAAYDGGDDIFVAGDDGEGRLLGADNEVRGESSACINF